jgi:hypothetical protein
LSKKITVYTNDPQQPTISLTISGRVERFVSISPPRVTLEGPAGQPLAATVAIEPLDKHPFKILKTKAQYGKHIRYRLRTVTEAGMPKYLMTIENLKQTAGRYYDVIYLNTDSDLKPQLRVDVIGRISE